MSVEMELLCYRCAIEVNIQFPIYRDSRSLLCRRGDSEWDYNGSHHDSSCWISAIIAWKNNENRKKE